jgi:hypothetical protein
LRGKNDIHDYVVFHWSDCWLVSMCYNGRGQN